MAPPAMRSLEFLGFQGDLFRLTHVAFGARPDRTWGRLERDEAVGALRRAADDVSLHRQLVALWSELGTGGGWTEESDPASAALRWAERELADPAGILVVWRWQRSRPAIDATPAPAIASLADLAPGDEPVEEHTWVAFRLLDLRGEPIADVSYELTLGDGSVEQGTTDANGEVRHEGIARGGCVLAFPDLPERYWEHAHNDG